MRTNNYNAISRRRQQGECRGNAVLTIFWSVGTQRKLSLWRWHKEVIWQSLKPLKWYLDSFISTRVFILGKPGILKHQRRREQPKTESLTFPGGFISEATAGGRAVFLHSSPLGDWKVPRQTASRWHTGTPPLLVTGASGGRIHSLLFPRPHLGPPKRVGGQPGLWSQTWVARKFTLRNWVASPGAALASLGRRQVGVTLVFSYSLAGGVRTRGLDSIRFFPFCPWEEGIGKCPGAQNTGWGVRVQLEGW